MALSMPPVTAFAMAGYFCAKSDFPAMPRTHPAICPATVFFA